MAKWHSEPKEKALKEFGTDPKKGIPDSRVQELRNKYGENRIAEKKGKSSLMLLLEQFNNPVIIILLAATIITIAIGDYKDSIVIGVVIILNTVIGYVQEKRAENALESLREMASPNATVVRDGEKQSIPTCEVVCGDLIVLESGVRVPADARIVESHSLMVDESMLTGETFASDKKADAEVDEKSPLGDRITMVYSGTIIQKGRALAVVTDVGAKTEFGKISESVAEAEETVSPLQENIEKFGKWLSFTIMAIVVLIFIVGFLRGVDLLTMFLTAVGLAVSAIPEGLPVAVTITLSIGISQMAKHNAIVKKLAAVETLGSTNVICTDKTGTLTKNEMKVNKMHIGDADFEVTGSGYSREGEIKPSDGASASKDQNKALEISGLVGALCTETSLSKKDGQWKVNGDPTEAALMIAAGKMGIEKDEWDVSIDLPFESENQIMAVKATNDNRRLVLAKGAPERILDRSDNMLKADGSKTDFDRDKLTEKMKEFSGRGLRVLALAYCEDCEIDSINMDTLKGLTFLGFAGIEDSIRIEAKEAVNECGNAGIRVVMITGDHVETARAVAESVDIAREKQHPEAIGVQDLQEMSDEELFDRVPDLDVYARVAPEHKFRIVRQLQKHNNIVAMTGDGVNDAPALKQADIGVAMGSGTDVAKEAAHMVLTDDNFATIVRAVRRGRVILKNLQHILLYILTTSFGGLLTIAMSVAVGFPLPVLPAQLLWINLVTDGTSTFPLAFEKEHGNVMIFKPRPKDAPLVTRDMIWRLVTAGTIMMIGTLGVFYYSLDDVYNPTPEELARARTLAFCVLAFFQIWNVQNSRSVDRSLFFKLPHPKMVRNPELVKEGFARIGPLKNPVLLGVMVGAILLQLGAVALPFMNTVLDTVPLEWRDWGIIFGVSFSVVIIVEMDKAIKAFVKTQLEKKKSEKAAQ
jgi:Ca2+-transporting ATPase